MVQRKFEQRYCCEECGKGTKSKTNLELHDSEHNGEKNC